MKKKQSKRSSKRAVNKKEELDRSLVIGFIIVIVAIVAYVSYFSTPTLETVVAEVNGEKISDADLAWWYEMSINPDYRQLVSQYSFLVTSLIPQTVLVGRAEKSGIEVSDDEVETLLGLYLIERGQTVSEFEEELAAVELTIDDIKSSFSMRVLVMKLLQEEGILGEDDLFINQDDLAFQTYLSVLNKQATIDIYPQYVLETEANLESTEAALCNFDKVAVRLYTKTDCDACEEISDIFNGLTSDLAAAGIIEAHHWVLDTGDDVLTEETEKGLPNEEVAAFKSDNPDKLVPYLNLGCSYAKKGTFTEDEAIAYRVLLERLTLI